MKIFVYIFFFVFTLACSNKQGPIFVKDTSGHALVGVPVQLVSLNDEGEVIEKYGTSFTGAAGDLDLDPPMQPDASLVYRAILPAGEVKAFAADVAQNGLINPVTDALVNAIVLVTETANGRTLSDFSTAEIQSLAAKAHAKILSTEVDFTNSDAVIAQMITKIGNDIAQAAGGSISVRPISAVVGTNTVTAAGTFANNGSCDAVEYQGNLFTFDFNQSGAACNVESITGTIGDAYDGDAHLVLVGQTFNGSTGFPGDPDFNVISAAPSVSVEDARELVFGPVTTDSGQLSVTRKVMAIEGQDVVRYLEIFNNLSSSEVTVSFQLLGNFGGLAPYRTLAAQANDHEFTEASHYGAFMTLVPNSRNPVIGYVFAGADAAEAPDNINFPLSIDDRYVVEYSATLPAQKTAVFAHYALVTSSFEYESIKDQLESIYESPNMSGFSALEIDSLKNFIPAIGNVIGEAGSVASGAALTLTSSGGAAGTVTAQSDGSFKAALNVSSGESVTVTGSDGTSKSFTVTN